MSTELDTLDRACSPVQQKRLDDWVERITNTTRFTETDVRQTCARLSRWGIAIDTTLSIVGPIAAYAHAWDHDLLELTDHVATVIALTDMDPGDVPEILDRAESEESGEPRGPER